jgi:hypothetical protein
MTLFKLTGTPGAHLRASWAYVVVPASGDIYTTDEGRAEELEALGCVRVPLETIQTLQQNDGPPLKIVETDTAPELTRAPKKAKRASRKKGA